jgi:hypothetical protein
VLNVFMFTARLTSFLPSNEVYEFLSTLQFYPVNYRQQSRDSSVGIVTRLRAG